jgi:hypothetical protein
MSPADDGGYLTTIMCDAGNNCSATTDPNGGLIYRECHDPSQGCGGYTRTFADGGVQMYSMC